MGNPTRPDLNAAYSIMAEREDGVVLDASCIGVDEGVDVVLLGGARGQARTSWKDHPSVCLT